MSDRYKVLASTMIGGRFFTEGEVITEKHALHDDDIKAAVNGKFVEREEPDTANSQELVDAVPEELTTEHKTKKVVPADKAGDKKAAQEG